MSGGSQFKAGALTGLQRMQREALLADIDFDADEFTAMPLDKRIDLCVNLAVQAKAWADAAPLQQQEHFLLIVYRWLRIAEEIERAIIKGSNDR